MPDSIYELGSNLQRLLSILKKNRDNVPKELLKTRYHDAYHQLIAQINETAQLYVKYVIGHHLFINPHISMEEQISVVQHTIDSSPLLSEMRNCLSYTYDAEKLHWLALKLREEVELALWPYINMETCLVADLDNIEKEPIIYNTITKQVYENDRWVDRKIDLSWKLLIYIPRRPYDKQLSADSAQERIDYGK